MDEIVWRQINIDHHTAWQGDKRVASVKYDARLQREVWDVSICGTDCQDRYLCNETCNWTKMKPCRYMGSAKTFEQAKQYVENVLAGQNREHRLWFWIYWASPRGITEEICERELNDGKIYYKVPNLIGSCSEDCFRPTLEKALEVAEEHRQARIREAVKTLEEAQATLDYWKDLKIKVTPLDAEQT